MIAIKGILGNQVDWKKPGQTLAIQPKDCMRSKIVQAAIRPLISPAACQRPRNLFIPSSSFSDLCRFRDVTATF